MWQNMGHSENAKRLSEYQSLKPQQKVILRACRPIDILSQAKAKAYSNSKIVSGDLVESHLGLVPSSSTEGT